MDGDWKRLLRAANAFMKALSDFYAFRKFGGVE